MDILQIFGISAERNSEISFLLGESFWMKRGNSYGYYRYDEKLWKESLLV
jgi:hypothetical protein